MAGTRVFNRRSRWLLRKRISRQEVFAGAAVLLLLGITLVWVLAQRGAYDPAARDLSYELLLRNPVPDTLYKTPFKPWRDPAADPKTVAFSANLAPFPPSLLDNGWRLRGSVRAFSPETLYEKINGEAEKFIKQGFQSLHYADLRSPGGTDSVAIELFDQGTFPGSLGIFSAHRTPGKKIESSEQMLYFTTPGGAIGLRGRYFFRIAASADSPAANQKTAQLLGALDKGLPFNADTLPSGYRILSASLGIQPANISYQNINAFQYDFASDFWFGQPDSAQATQVFVHESPSTGDARALFQDIVSEHSLDYDISRETADEALLRHPFLNTWFAMAVRKAMLVGVEQAPSPDAAETLLARLVEAVNN